MQAQSAASTEVKIVELSAPATFAQVREYAEYKALAGHIEEATALINDAVATGTILRSNGTALTEFPTYLQLRFIATQEGGVSEATGKYVDRGFNKSHNARRVRAACLAVYENSPKPASNGDTTIRTKSQPAMRATARNFDPKYILIEWRGDVTATQNGCYQQLKDHKIAVDAYNKSKLEEVAGKMGVSLDELAAMFAK